MTMYKPSDEEVHVAKYDIDKFYSPALYPKYQTKEMCEYFVRMDGSLLSCVQQKYNTQELCNMAVMGENGAWDVLKYVPHEFKTYEMCMHSVRANPHALEFVLEALQTPEMCLEALEKRWHVVIYRMIKIPIEGNFKRSMKLLHLFNGRIETAHTISMDHLRLQTEFVIPESYNKLFKKD